MITFAEARRIVEGDAPGGATTAPYGYESDEHWFPLVLPERIGGRVPGVSKSDGALVWMSSLAPEYSESRPWSGEAKSFKHLPGQHNQQDHAGVSSINAIAGISVLDADEYASLYGDVWDDAGVDLGNDGDVMGLTARFHETGDLHVVLDLENGKSQVFEEMDPEGMRQLAYDLEEVLAVDEDEFDPDDPYDVIADAGLDKHGFYVAKNGVGDIWIRPPDAADDDYLELSAEQALEFSEALLNIADSYEEHFDEDGNVKAIKHPGHPDQSVHGRRRKPPSIDMPSIPEPAPAAAPSRSPKPPKPSTGGRSKPPASSEPPKPRASSTARRVTPAQAQKMQDAMTADRPWTADQRESLRTWTTSGFHDIRMMIQNPNHEPFLGIGGRAQVKQHIRNMRDSMRPLPKPVKVFRKADPEGVGLKRGDDPRTLVGKVMQNPNFTATSVEPDAGFLGTSRPILVEIDAPAGTPAAYLESLTETKGEKELLLDAGLPLEFLSAKARPDGVVVLKARVVQ